MTIQPELLQELKEKLLSEKVRTEEELGRIGKPAQTVGKYTTTFNEIGTDEDENASEIEEYTDNLALETNLQNQLKEIVAALERLETGSYGKCDNCGADIPIERLRAYPAAKKCLNCQ